MLLYGISLLSFSQIGAEIDGMACFPYKGSKVLMADEKYSNSNSIAKIVV